MECLILQTASNSVKVSNYNLPESQPGRLLVELIHLPSLPLVQQPDALLPLLSELPALLLHLLTEQRAPHAHALLELPALALPLAVGRHSGLALVGRQDFQLPLQPVRQEVGLLLLGLVKANLIKRKISTTSVSIILGNVPIVSEASPR